MERGIGDVLLAWENEAFLAVKELGPDKVQIVVPSLSILAEPPVSIVDKVVDRHGTRNVAEGYLQYLYSKEGQEIAAKHFYRPRDPEIAAKYAKQFPTLSLVTIDDTFGRLGQGAGGAFRRRRDLRPDLWAVVPRRGAVGVR